MKKVSLCLAMLCSSFLIACEPTSETSTANSAANSPMANQAKAEKKIVRVAVFNVWELSREKLDHQADGQFGSHPQLQRAAEIIQRVRPDILLINEIDFDEAGAAVRDFEERYLNVSQSGQEPLGFAHAFVESVNTGFPSGLDLNQDGTSDGPDDAFGFGRYPGQYGMALLSRFPFDRDRARTFQNLLWTSMPGHLMPDGQDGRPAYYSAEAAEIFRLSSKSHWDVPVQIGEHTLHILACHPTPPVFDDEEDRNGRRNHDEIRLFADYISGGERASYIVDDQGGSGGLATDAHFVLLGDLNADRFSDQTPPTDQPAIAQLLDHPRINDPQPKGHGELAKERPYAGPKELRTSAYGRLDYALPSNNLDLRDSGVFWPAPDDPLNALVSGEDRASDHKLVWVDVVF